MADDAFTATIECSADEPTLWIVNTSIDKE